MGEGEGAGVGEVTVAEAVPEIDPLLAAMLSVPTVPGAVKRPAELIVPPPAVQVNVGAVAIAC